MAEGKTGTNKITLSFISCSYAPCLDQTAKSLIILPDDLIKEVNDRVRRDYAKILEVRVKKIINLLRVDIDVELYSKECYYFLTRRTVIMDEVKKFENFSETLTENSQSIFFGSDYLITQHEQNYNIIYGIYLELYDRREPYINGQGLTITEEYVNAPYGMLFPPDQYPIIIYNELAKYLESKRHSNSYYVQYNKNIKTLLDLS